MYLQRIRITNIRSIPKIDWRIPAGRPLAGWHVVVGGRCDGLRTAPRIATITAFLKVVHSGWQHNAAEREVVRAGGGPGYVGLEGTAPVWNDAHGASITVANATAVKNGPALRRVQVNRHPATEKGEQRGPVTPGVEVWNTPEVPAAFFLRAGMSGARKSSSALSWDQFSTSEGQSGKVKTGPTNLNYHPETNALPRRRGAAW